MKMGTIAGCPTDEDRIGAIVVDQIKHVSPVSQKHINSYGKYDLLYVVCAIDLSANVDWLEELKGRGKVASFHFAALGQKHPHSARRQR
jgi:hypothetical protein